MAGPYVHCLVAREALRRLYDDPDLVQFRSITTYDENAQYFQYVCLGSVSPDYPYPAIRIEGGDYAKKDKNGWTWGDKFHKQNTGNFIDLGIQALRAIEDRDEVFLEKAAWLMGYYSHVITDLVIHAVVYKLVGGCYENHSTEHLHCEVIQDSLLFYDVYTIPPKDLIDEKFLIRVLMKCPEKPGPDWIPTEPPPNFLNKEIKNFWDSILGQNYPDFYKTNPPQIDEWHQAYCSIANDATGVIARKIVPGMAYHRAADIIGCGKMNYYENVNLPNGKSGNYRDNVFEKAVDDATNHLKDFLKALNNSDSYRALKEKLDDWNLDKGIMADTNPKFALWDGEITDLLNCNGDPLGAK